MEMAYCLKTERLNPAMQTNINIWMYIDDGK